MKHKNGREIQILGEIAIDSKQHFLCKLPAFYNNGILVSVVAIPVSDFVKELDNLVEVVNNEHSVDSRDVPEANRSQTGTIQAEGNT